MVTLPDVDDLIKDTFYYLTHPNDTHTYWFFPGLQHKVLILFPLYTTTCTIPPYIQSGYYIIVLPVAVGLMFPFGADLGVMGFWWAQLMAQSVLALLLLIYQLCIINWNEEIDNAKERTEEHHHLTMIETAEEECHAESDGLWMD